MNVAFQRNVGSFLKTVPALAAQTITAGGAADGVAQNGITFDRESLIPVCLSALAVIHAEVDVAAAETVQCSIAVQDSANGSDWATYDPGPPDDYAAEVADADGHVTFTRKIQLGGARRYVRIVPTFTLSAANTDTVKVDGVLVVAGADELPIA